MELFRLNGSSISPGVSIDLDKERVEQPSQPSANDPPVRVVRFMLTHTPHPGSNGLKKAVAVSMLRKPRLYISA